MDHRWYHCNMRILKEKILKFWQKWLVKRNKQPPQETTKTHLLTLQMKPHSNPNLFQEKYEQQYPYPKKNSVVSPLTGKSRLLFLFIIVHSITHNRPNTNFVLFFGNLKQKPQFHHQHRGHMSVEIIHIMVSNKSLHVAYNKRR